MAVAAAVQAAVRVAMVLTPRQPDLGPSPMVLAPPRVSKAASQFQRGLNPPSLGAVLGTGSLPRAGSCSCIDGSSPWWPTSGVSSGCEVSLLFFPFLGFRGLGSFLGFGVLGFGFGFGVPGFAFLDFFPAAVPWIHPLHHQALMLSVSFVVVQGLPVCPGLLPAWYPHQGRLCASGLPSCVPFEFNWFLIRVTFVVVWEHGCLAVEAMLL